MILKRFWLNFVREAFFPAECALCKDLLYRRQGLCQSCFNRLKLELLKGPRCPLCSRPQPAAHLCVFCRKRKDLYFFDQVEALFSYERLAKEFICAFKFSQKYFLSNIMAAFLKQAACSKLAEGYILVPAPSSSKAGSFNAISHELRKLGAPVCDILAKKRGPAQKKLSAQKRWRAMENRVFIKKNCRVPRRVLLVDDVFTTGATLAECARALKKAGSLNVAGLVLAIDPLQTATF